MKLRFQVFAIFLFSLIQLAKAQDKVYMPFFEVINLNAEYQYSASRLLKSYMDERGRYMLLLPEKPEGLYPVQPADQVKSKAASLGAKYYIIGDLNRVGEVVVVTIIMYNTSDGSKYWSDKLRAQTPDELDPILQKLAVNMGNAARIETTDNNYNTDYNKIEAKYSLGVSVGGAFLFSGGSDPLPGIGIFGTYDAPNIILEIKGQGYFSKGTDIVVGSLEAYYPFNQERITPFLGGGLGMGFTSVPGTFGTEENNAGLMLLAGGGYFFNRNSNASLRLSGNLFSGLYNGGRDTGLMLRMEILFAR